MLLYAMTREYPITIDVCKTLTSSLFQMKHLLGGARKLRYPEIIYFFVQVRLGTELLRTPSSITNDSTLHVTETRALTTRPSVTSMHQ